MACLSETERNDEVHAYFHKTFPQKWIDRREQLNGQLDFSV